MNKTLRLAILVGLGALLLAVGCLPSLGAVIYVKPTGHDTNNGLSWTYAKQTVQSAINTASASEVWVATGTYVANITLKSGVSVYGGFAGTEALRTQRKPSTYVTYLDGGNADTVVTAPVGATAATVIDGFTIRNGRGASGGGIYAANSAVTISNNTIRDNTALYYGGGIYGESSTLTIINNTVTANKAPFGGGIACYDSSAPTIALNRIYSNTADYDGSGIYCYSNSTPIIASNVIYSNNALSEGAGVYCDDASPTIVNNTISDNTALIDGGGVGCLDSSPTIANNIIAYSSSGIHSAGSGTPAIRNNVVSGNVAYGYSGVGAGTDDMSTDPSFANRTPPSPPLTGGGAGGGYHVNADSPAIDAGWNEASGLGPTDIDGGTRIQGGAIDIGAYETASAPSPLGSLRDSKAGRRNAWVKLIDLPVSAAFPGFFYIQADNRISGIRVEKADHAITQGQRAAVEGVVRTNANGERYLYALTASGSGAVDVNPLFMLNKAVGGSDWQFDPLAGTGQQGVSASGLNNIGLLVKISGTFHYDAPDTFTMDDGSGIKIKCVTTADVVVQPLWSFAAVTGVSSCERAGSSLTRLIRVRNQNDIQAF